MRFRLFRSVPFVMLLGLPGVTPDVAVSTAPAQGAAAQIARWAPRAVIQDAFLGSVSTVQVVFRPAVELIDVEFRVVPALAPYVSVLNAGGATLASGQPVTVTLLVSVPADAPLGRVDGTLHVISGTRGTVAPPLPFTLELRPPGPPVQTVGPEGGMFGFAEGIVLAIPPGAVPTWTDITITPLPCALVDQVLAAQLTFGHQRRCLGGFVAEPSGLVFALPVTAWMPVSVPLQPTEFPMLATVNLDEQTVTPQAAELTYWGVARTLETTVRHFSKKIGIGVSTMSSDEERQCRTCAGYLDPACQSFNDDPLGQAQCLLSSANRLACGVPGACCKELGVKVTTSEIDTSSGQCEVTGSAVQVSFPFCPGGEQVEVDVRSTVNCPGDWKFEAAVRPAEVSLYVCQAQTLEAILQGVSADGSRMLSPVPTVADWQSDDPRLLLTGTPSSVVTARAWQPSHIPINVLATVNSTDPILRGVSHVTILEPDISIEALDGRPLNPLALRPGDSVGLRAALTPSFAYEPVLEVWSTGDPDVAAIDTSSGVLTAVSPGSTMAEVALTYAIGECQHTVRAQVPVEVGPRIPHHVEVDPPSGRVRINGTLDLTATVFDQYSQPIPGVPVQWQIASGTGTIELISADALPPRATVRGFAAGEGRVAATVPEAPDALPGYSDITVDPVDASITLEPLMQITRTGSPQLLTAQVETNDGTGFANAPAATMITFTIVSGPGVLSAASCLTMGGTGSCSVTLTSNAVGVTIVRASTTVTVNGVPLSRSTDGVAPNSGNATINWSQTYRITWSASATGAGTCEQTNPGFWDSSVSWSFEASWSASMEVDYSTRVVRNAQMQGIWTDSSSSETRYYCDATSFFTSTNQWTVISPDLFLEDVPRHLFPQVVTGGELVFTTELFHGGFARADHVRTGRVTGHQCTLFGTSPIDIDLDQSHPNVPFPVFPFPIDLHGKIPADDASGRSFTVLGQKVTSLGACRDPVPMEWDLRITLIESSLP